MINAALIGKGRWGQIYIKTLSNIKNINISGIYTHDYKKILHDDSVNCVIIATPVESHYEIAKNCLLANKHVLVEKPFTDNSNKALELSELAFSLNKILLVGHIYLHHYGIIKLKELIDNGSLGDIRSFFSRRMSISNNHNALWEMATHDIYILNYFFGNNIKKIEVVGKKDHCCIIIKYVNDLYAVIEVSSHYPIKTRQISIEGTEKMAIFDDEAKNRLITINNREPDVSTIIEINNIYSPLEKQCKHFFDCITNNDKPISSGYDGYNNIKVLEAINNLI